MTVLTDVLKKKLKAAETFHEEINNPEDRKVRENCPYTVWVGEKPTKIAT